MRIALASDHAGFHYRLAIRDHLAALGHDVIDLGCPDPSPCDYPAFIRPAAEALARGEVDRAIVLGGSGNGEAMVANRVPGVRCALVWSEATARWARGHNDANAMALGARTVDLALALRLVDLFLGAPFDGGRHTRRVAAIDESPPSR